MARDLGTQGSQVHAEAADVLRFWLGDVAPEHRFAVDPLLDQEIARRFGAMRAAVIASGGAEWRHDARSALAAVILLDQFSRNIFRGRSEAFAADALARDIADEAIAAGRDALLDPNERQFLYMPFLHAEDQAAQARSLSLFATIGGVAATYARLHAGQIARFGRFPQRNAALGRDSTAEETTFLADPDNHF